MASEESGSNVSADSYIGSLISLTSKSEIRYEGFLYSINTDESSIGLVNVRSYGTEGRKKDGQQVPPSDKIYGYILFRGSDIKDLQVKASPPVQAVLPDHNDPAIIKSEYSRPSSMPSSVSSAGSRPVEVSSNYTPQMEAPKSTFHSSVPLYQPGGSFGSWGSSPPNTDASSSVSTSLPSASSGNVEVSSSYAPHIAAPRSTVQDGLPMYERGGSLGSWGYSSLPSADGSSLSAPMYWQGFYGTSSGISHAQQPSSHGLLTPDFMHQPLFPGTNTSKLTASSNLPASNLSTPISPVSKMSAPNLPPSKSSAPNLLSPSLSIPNLSTSHMSAPILHTPNQAVQNLPASNSQELVHPLLPPFNGSVNSTSNTLHCTLFSQSAALPSELASNVVSNMGSSGTSVATLGSHLPLIQPNINGFDKNGTTVLGSVPKTAPILPLPRQTIPPYLPPVAMTPNLNHSENSKRPVLITPDQLLQPRPALLSLPLLSHPAKKDVEVVQAVESNSHPAKNDVEVVRAAASKPPLLPIAITQAPLLPLPSSVNQKISRPVTRFTEEFDFTAMNEKFKKDEVWDDLGKTNKTANNEEDRKENHRYVSEGADAVGLLKNDPVYVKDDFFDSLSCNSLDNQQRNGFRRKFSEQMKIDTETFGDFRRNQAGRGGRGSSRGGRSQGFYYGRGRRYY